MTFAERVAVLELVASPVWVFDIVNNKVVWANARGLAFWNSPNLEEFSTRNFLPKSSAQHTREVEMLETIEAGREFAFQQTFFPRGVAITAQCHASGIRLDDGHIAMLVQALDVKGEADAALVRGIEALRHIWAMVAMVDGAGAVLMQNPAGMRAFGRGGSMEGWFLNEEAARIGREVSAGRVFRGELLARTLAGERWHLVEAHRTVDPLTAGAATLLLQMDVTALRESQEMVERQREQIRALSVPILEVGEGALALPLIGGLDEARCQVIASLLLPAVAERRAGSVILDLTGVDALEGVGVEGLMAVVRAVELLGARVVLTGIQPLLARALLDLGRELGGVLTLRSLAEGISACRRG